MERTEFLELKTELLINGIKSTPEALKELGSKYKEQNHGLFGWDFEDHTNIALPDDFALPDDTIYSPGDFPITTVIEMGVISEHRLAHGVKDRPQINNIDAGRRQRRQSMNEIGPVMIKCIIEILAVPGIQPLLHFRFWCRQLLPCSIDIWLQN